MLAGKSLCSLATFKTYVGLFKLTEFHKKKLCMVPFKNGIVKKYRILDLFFPCNDQVNRSDHQKATVF